MCVSVDCVCYWHGYVKLIFLLSQLKKLVLTNTLDPLTE